MPDYTIGLFYGSSTCYTEIAAEKIADFFAAHANSQVQLDVHDVKSRGVNELANYNYLILGIPTWDYGELQEDWEAHWTQLDSLDLTGVTVALYGLGDQIGYPEWFQDAMGYLHEKMLERGANCVGYWPVAGYQFDASLALTADKQYFVGLPLDDENEFDQSEQRIAQWCRQVFLEFFDKPLES